MLLYHWFYLLLILNWCSWCGEVSYNGVFAKGRRRRGIGTLYACVGSYWSGIIKCRWNWGRVGGILRWYPDSSSDLQVAAISACFSKEKTPFLMRWLRERSPVLCLWPAPTSAVLWCSVRRFGWAHKHVLASLLTLLVIAYGKGSSPFFPVLYVGITQGQHGPGLYSVGVSRVFTSGCRNQDFVLRMWTKPCEHLHHVPLLSEAKNCCMTCLLLETDPQGSCWWVWGATAEMRTGLGVRAGSTHLCHSRSCWAGVVSGSDNRLEDHCQGPHLEDLG